jgi:cytoskeletal protein CcmA (bactofilin family)
LNSSAVVEGDIFHKSLSIEENARFEGSSKREDNAAKGHRQATALRFGVDEALRSGGFGRSFRFVAYASAS